MSMLNELFNIFEIEECEISERIKVLQSNFEYDGSKLPPIEKIKDVLSKFPIRDKVLITMTNFNDESIIICNQNEYSTKYEIESFYKLSVDDFDVQINFEINKEIITNTLSVYNFEKFSEYITSKHIIDIMKIFNSFLKNQEYLVFELYDSNLLFWTNTMIFKNYQQNSVEMNFPRKNKIEVCRQISSFYNITDYELIPEDFEILSNIANNIFESVFSKIRTLLSMVYISNTSIINNEFIDIEVIGQRKTSFSYNIDTQLLKNDELYKIYKWIFTDGNAVDKAIIARNIISLHCQFTDILKTDRRTFASIQSNFGLYQKDNVVKYIELKNKLAEYILNIVTETSDIVIGLADKIKNNLIACFTFLFSVIVANIVSDKPLDNIFTKDITFILEAVLFGSVVYLVISVLEMNYKLKKLKDGYDDLKNNYNGILDENDILEIFNNDDTLKSNIKEVKKKRLALITVWIILLIISCIAIENISKSPIIYPIIKNIGALFNAK